MYACFEGLGGRLALPTELPSLNKVITYLRTYLSNRVHSRCFFSCQNVKKVNVLDISVWGDGHVFNTRLNHVLGGHVFKTRVIIVNIRTCPFKMFL